MPSFTTQVPNLQQVGLVVEVRIAVGTALEEIERNAGREIPTPAAAAAMIDTGATGTVLRDDIPQQLGLNPVGVALISTPSSANVQCYRYAVRLLFPNRVVVETLAIAAPLQGQHIQCLIGRDVLKHGVFVYTGYIDQFTLSF